MSPDLVFTKIKGLLPQKFRVLAAIVALNAITPALGFITAIVITWSGNTRAISSYYQVLYLAGLVAIFVVGGNDLRAFRGGRSLPVLALDKKKSEVSVSQHFHISAMLLLFLDLMIAISAKAGFIQWTTVSRAVAASLWGLLLSHQLILCEHFKFRSRPVFAALLNGVIANSTLVFVLVSAYVLRFEWVIDHPEWIGVMAAATAVTVGTMLEGPHREASSVPNRPSAGEILAYVKSYVSPLIASKIGTFLLTQGCFFVVVALTTSKQEANYAIAQRLTVIFGILTVLPTYFLPGYFNDEPTAPPQAGWSAKIKVIVRFTSLAAVSIFACYAIVGRDVLAALFAIDVSEVFALSIVLIIGQLISLIGGPADYVLVLIKDDVALAKINLCAGVFAIATCWIMTHKFGVIGACVAYVVAVAMQKTLLNSRARQRTGTSVWLMSR